MQTKDRSWRDRFEGTLVCFAFSSSCSTPLARVATSAVALDVGRHHGSDRDLESADMIEAK